MDDDFYAREGYDDDDDDDELSDFYARDDTAARADDDDWAKLEAKARQDVESRRGRGRSKMVRRERRDGAARRVTTRRDVLSRHDEEDPL